MILTIQKLNDLFLKSLDAIFSDLEEDSIDDLLDNRDSDDFSGPWIDAYNEIKDPISTQNKEDLDLINTFRKEIFIFTFSKTNSSDLSAYISDDYDLICSHILCGDTNNWVAALCAHYFDHKIPEGILTPLNKKISELIREY